MMNSLAIMKRHLGNVEEIELDNGEKINVGMIPAEFMPEYLVAQNQLQSGEIIKDSIESMRVCIEEALKAGNPKDAEMSDEEYKKILHNFSSEYFFLLFDRISNMNRCGMTDKELERITKIQGKVEKENAAKHKGDTGKVKKD